MPQVWCPQGLRVPNERFLLVGDKGQVFVRGAEASSAAANETWDSTSINPPETGCHVFDLVAWVG
jgi:hypothetical protein